MEEEQEKTSKFAGGLAQIYRLDGLWKDTNSHSRQGNYYKWNLDLDRIWLELARDLKEDDFTEKEKEFNAFDREIAELGDFNDEKPKGFIELTEEQTKNRSEIYKILMRKELFLRRLENSLGKGTAFDEGDDDDFD